jgi:hypothetical protein
MPSKYFINIIFKMKNDQCVHTASRCPLVSSIYEHRASMTIEHSTAAHIPSSPHTTWPAHGRMRVEDKTLEAV